MKEISASGTACSIYLDQLDSWLAQELDAALVPAMQAHHKVCAACQKETRLAHAIDLITAALPAPACPDFGAVAAAQTNTTRAAGPLSAPQQGTDATARTNKVWPTKARFPAARGNAIFAGSLISRLMDTWRQPLVFMPAIVLVVVALVISQFRVSGSPDVPRIVIVDGEAYTVDEITRAAKDLDLALRYLDKYGSYPARVVQFQLEQSRLPLPAPQEGGDPPSI